VSESASGPAVPALFGQALDAVREATTRPELVLTEIPAPVGLAPHAIAMAGDVRPARHGVDSLLGTGRFVLLHDPDAEPGPDWSEADVPGCWTMQGFARGRRRS